MGGLAGAGVRVKGLRGMVSMAKVRRGPPGYLAPASAPSPQPTAGISPSDVAWDEAVGPFTCFGRSWTIRTTDQAVTKYLRTLFAPMADVAAREPIATVSLIAPTSGRVGAVYRDDRYVGSGDTPARLLGHVIWAINRLVIHPDPAQVVLHAAAAAISDGAAVVLPAPMESGKTTLVTALLDRGLTYLTDEAALIDDALRVWGYRKPLSIDPGSWQVLAHHRPVVAPAVEPYLVDQWQVPPAGIGPTAESANLVSIVFPRYEVGAAAKLLRVQPALAVRRLAACTFGPEGAPVSVPQMSKIARFASSVPVYELTFGCLDDACVAVLSTLDHP
jgi:hypothetical protein